MFPQNSPTGESLDSETYPLGEKSERSVILAEALALVALSHTLVENIASTAAMLSARRETPGNNSFTARHLMTLTQDSGALALFGEALKVWS